jgi:molybdopterin molybdotransferase
LNNRYVKKPGLTHFLKGFVSDDKVTILPDQESYKLTSFSEANCLIIIPEETTEITEGQLVEYHLI